MGANAEYENPVSAGKLAEGVLAACKQRQCR